MNTAGVALIAVAGAVAAVMGVIGLAHIEAIT